MMGGSKNKKNCHYFLALSVLSKEGEGQLNYALPKVHMVVVHDCFFLFFFVL